MSDSATESLSRLCQELVEMLETIEETDEGRAFHPTTIRSCRCMVNDRLARVMSGIRVLSLPPCPEHGGNLPVTGSPSRGYRCHQCKLDFELRPSNSVATSPCAKENQE
jgi:hypothetical protein